MKSVIYETKGRAREFNELAINLFTGCGHMCIYCYGAKVTHQDKEQWENDPKPRVTAEEIDQSAWLWQKIYNGRRILLCFVTDPYQPIEAETQLTRQAIEILHKYGMYVHILTKGGARAMRDFDLLTPKDAFAVTLTCDNDVDSLKWEPNSAVPGERLDVLEEAHDAGIETWVSLEPVIYPDQVERLVMETKGFVDHYKVGTMNYHPHGKTIDFAAFGRRMKRIMDQQGIKYYFKKDLLKEMGILPANFEQKWVCR